MLEKSDYLLEQLKWRTETHDHPLTDILHYAHPVYGAEADNLVCKIARLCGQLELTEWWEREIGWQGSEETILRKGQLQLDSLLKRAKDGGWEMQD